MSRKNREVRMPNQTIEKHRKSRVGWSIRVKFVQVEGIVLFKSCSSKIHRYLSILYNMWAIHMQWRFKAIIPHKSVSKKNFKRSCQFY